MKEKFNIISANIQNLTSLWKTASIPFQSYFKTSVFEYCEIKNADWPNRLWFHQDIDEEIIALAKAKLLSNSVNLTIPYWKIYKSKSYDLLEKTGFKILFEQAGMSLKLNRSHSVQNNLNIRLVSKESEAKLWAELFVKSFGYRINQETILKTNNEIHYYTAYYKNEAIGTAILHKTHNIAGIHAVGIPPEMRRKGFAEQIMKLLINLAIKNGNNGMTLQASDIGKNLYLKLGFEEQFVIKNYALQ